MPRTKRKRQDTLYREGERPTDEWLAHNDAETIEAPRIAGHDHGNVKTVRRVNRAAKWERDGWVSGEQRKALEAWERLNDSARLEGVKARDYADPRGAGADGCRPEHIAMARRRLGEVNLALAGECGARITRSVWCWLTTGDAIDFRQFDTGGRDGRLRCISMVRRVADALERMRI